MTLQNLNDRDAIVDVRSGAPTPYFMRLLQNRGGLLTTAQDQLNSLLAVEFIAGTGLSGGGIMQDAIDANPDAPTITFDLEDTAVTPGTYGSATEIPVITVDQQGRLTLVTEVVASGGAGLIDADYGDITVSGVGTVMTIDNDVVTYAKMQNASAGNVVLTRATGTAGNYGETALAASELLGRGSTGNVAAISLGTGLSMSGTVLSATGSYTAENARDDIGAALVAGANTKITPDDGADTITVTNLGSAPLTETTTARTAALSDASRYIQFTNAAASAFTIPPNASVAFDIGTIITIEQNNTGIVTFTAGAGVTLTGRSATGQTGGRYAVAQIKKVATNTWNMLGDLT